MHTRQTSGFIEGFEPFVEKHEREPSAATFDEVESYGRVVKNAVDKYIKVGEAKGAGLWRWIKELERSSDNPG